VEKKGGIRKVMTVKLPEGEILRRAIQWINEQQELTPKSTLIALVEEAGKRFDLSPKDSDFLIRFFTGSSD
jgi:hypothetical protein